MRRILAHADVVLGGMILVLLCIDRVNDAMEFINHPLTKWILFALCASTILSGVFLHSAAARARIAREERREERRAARRNREAAPENEEEDL